VADKINRLPDAFDMAEARKIREPSDEYVSQMQKIADYMLASSVALCVLVPVTICLAYKAISGRAR